MSEYLWHCPFCNTDQTVSEAGRHAVFADLSIENAEGPRRLVVKYVVCPNPRCREFSLSASLHTLEIVGNRSYTGKHLKSWNLVPPSRARSFPVSVPEAVLEDYREACLLQGLSAKTAAALARRCLSSMLRDFWRVQPGSLSDELRQVKGTVDPLTWEAIESVRNTGRIGARMEGESAEVRETEEGEAQLLIGLIETLIVDWYVAREERRKRLEEIRQIAGKGLQNARPE
ncbi:MAG: DUF4145 domain-containing protein [Nitrospiraceae bacterium]|nr:DUF4145 domain-containing protein [Nitrospiraceae bacterium]